ncbi:unnamed protein product [Paramecium primaurelia]|uniref:Uncharacterized protein n=1 Tax=Paramecium primaurelia TaxID=5886 RepID=A0A8S1LEY9_PARPR|nr:unnamed protein product [Paramecium primaurelia]
MHIILQCLVLAQLILITLSQSCLNSKGQEVDWWFILKMPKNRDEGWTGFEYFYCDKDNDCIEFNLQDDNLDSATSPLMQTIKTIDFTDDKFISILWSDQPNGKITYSNHAHSKGIMRAGLEGKKNAFIISHSTPRFPKLNEYGQIDDEVEDNFARNGQHFLCLSTTTDKIDEILAESYYEAEIQIYKVSQTPTKIFGRGYYPNIQKLWQTKKPGKGESHHRYSKTTLYSHVRFTTRENQKFKIFSKNEDFEQDFYAKFVAEELQQDLIMETWVRQKGKGLDKPVCEKYQTSSNHQVSFHGKNKHKDVTFTYSYTKDHSKYGITLPRDPTSTSKGESFITTDYSQSSLKGQILTSVKNLQRSKIFNVDEDTVIKEDEDEDEEMADASPKPDDSMDVDHPKKEEKLLGRKRKRDEPEELEPPSKKMPTEKKNKDKYVCVSDLNRQQSQWFRGGVVYCFYNENLWGHIDKAFVGKQLCKS